MAEDSIKESSIIHQSLAEVATSAIKNDQVVNYVRNAFEKGKPIEGEAVTQEKAAKVYVRYNLEELLAGSQQLEPTDKPIVIIGNGGLHVDIHPMSKVIKDSNATGNIWVLHFSPGGADQKSELNKKGISEIGALVMGRKDLRKILNLLDSDKLAEPKYIFGGNTNPIMNNFVKEAGFGTMIDVNPGFFSDKQIANIELGKLRNYINRKQNG